MNRHNNIFQTSWQWSCLELDLYGIILEFPLTKYLCFVFRWSHNIHNVPSVSRVLVGIKSVIHERSETSIPKSKTKWKYNLNCIYIPEDDNISDVEEQTAVRGDGGGQKSNIYFPIFGKIWLPQLGKNFLLFFAQGSFENCPGQFFYLIWKS